MGMSVSQIGNSQLQAPAVTQTQPSLEAKRAALQSMILRKSLENQQNQADAMGREAEGKGQNLDIRV